MNQDEKNNDNQEKRQNRWKYCTVGTCIAVAAYGIYKLLKKEEWKLAEVIGSGIAGGSVSSIVAPKLVKLARETQWSLRSEEQKTYPVYSNAPTERAVSYDYKDKRGKSLNEVVKKLEMLQDKIEKATEVTEPTIYTLNWRDIIDTGTVTLIIGKRGSGKTCLGQLIIEDFSSVLPCCVVGLPQEAALYLPDRIGVYPNLQEVPLGLVILIDEGSFCFPSQNISAQMRKLLLESIILARQRRQTFIIMVQDSSYIDRHILRGVDNLIIREPAPLQSEFERREIREYIRKADEGFSSIEGNRKSLAYVAFSSKGFSGWVRTKKPTFWSEKLSNAYALSLSSNLIRSARSLSTEEKILKARELQGKGSSIRQIAEEIGMSKSWVFEKLKQYSRVVSTSESFSCMDTILRNSQN